MGTESKRLEDKEWYDLTELIRNGKCTPFIGAGASYPIIPTGSELAKKLASEHDYPLSDRDNLARVAQYLAIDRYEMYPKDMLQKQFQSVAPPDFSDPYEPHAALADLQLPIYITTNYDNFMVEALKSRKKDPVQEHCRWNEFPQVIGKKSILDTDYKPTPAQPLVYHLHGYHQIPQSMVLTEDDYLNFVTHLSTEQDFLPYAIREALVAGSLLFVGYSLSDWNFRLLFRGLIGSIGAGLGYSSVAVQLPPPKTTDEVYFKNGDRISGQITEQTGDHVTIENDHTGKLRIDNKFVERAVTRDTDSQRTRQKQEEYLDRYFEKIQKIKIRIYWGDARDFTRELVERMKKP